MSADTAHPEHCPPTMEPPWEGAPEAGICIDACIADTIVDAWTSGLRTLGSCCGHGDGPPAVVLTQDRDQPDIARGLLPGWTLYQWRLTDVTQPFDVEEPR